MPLKKAAKKAPAKHADPKHQAAKDLRRSYEHLGRVELLRGSLDNARSKHIHPLVKLAEQELAKGHRKEAADLLRAAEHFSFAALAEGGGTPGRVSDELVRVVTEELEHLERRANDHWDEQEDEERHLSLTELFHSALRDSTTAAKAGQYRRALELARSAEALSHVKKHGPDELGEGEARLDVAKF